MTPVILVAQTGAALGSLISGPITCLKMSGDYRVPRPEAGQMPQVLCYMNGNFSFEIKNFWQIGIPKSRNGLWETNGNDWTNRVMKIYVTLNTYLFGWHNISVYLSTTFDP